MSRYQIAFIAALWAWSKCALPDVSVFEWALFALGGMLIVEGVAWVCLRIRCELRRWKRVA